MIVYEARPRETPSADALAETLALADAPDLPLLHDRITAVLVGAAALEVGVADARFPDRDGLDHRVEALAACTGAAARALVRSWRGEPGTARRELAGARASLRAVDPGTLPDTVDMAPGEGFAFYGLYPEGYLEAVRGAVPALAGGPITCVGLRRIGAALASVVAAVLQERGLDVARVTVRPRGHPFDRELRLAPELAERLRARSHGAFLVVDEGPGLSGSSFAAAARALEGLGVGPDRVFLMPSWAAPPAALNSPEGRRRWQRHPRLLVSYEECWLRTGRLARALPAGRWDDLSAGGWRRLHFADPAAYPATSPAHERRKYRLRTEGGAALHLRFAGLGSEGVRRLHRARALAAAGFGVAPLGLAHGYLIEPWVPGRPLRRGGAADAALDRVARYLAHLWREQRAGGAADPEALAEPLRLNAVEALGERAAAGVLRGADPGRVPPGRPRVAVDGRMQPHEWLALGGGLIKTDALDHHDDHFLPGCTDIAWDLAGAIVEWELDGGSARRLLAAYERASGDRGARAALPFYRAAYLAQRVGRVALALDAQRGAEEEPRLRTARDRYARALRHTARSAPA